MGKASWVASITRGTNKYRDKTVVMYLHKENINPNLAEYLNMNNQASKDHNTLAELIQLIYRSAIRDGKPIDFVTASEKNIEILNRFLDVN